MVAKKSKSAKGLIKQRLQAKIIELVNMSELQMLLQRRILGLEVDNDPKTFTGTEEIVKDLIKKLAKAKAKR